MSNPPYVSAKFTKCVALAIKSLFIGFFLLIGCLVQWDIHIGSYRKRGKGRRDRADLPRRTGSGAERQGSVSSIRSRFLPYKLCQSHISTFPFSHSKVLSDVSSCSGLASFE